MIDKDEIAALIPHRGRMLLLSGINEYNLEERTLSAEYHVTKDCLFYDPSIDAVPAWVGFEFMAQAISALSGIGFRARGEKPKLGFILSISSMKIKIPFFRAGTKVELRVKECSRIDQVYNFEGVAFLEGKSVMEGKLTIMEADDMIIDKGKRIN